MRDSDGPETNMDEYLKRLSDLRTSYWPDLMSQSPEYPFGIATIPEYIRRWRAKDDRRPALIFGDEVTTFGELDRASDQIAGYLTANGLVVGDRVAVMMQNCPDFVTVFIGTLKAGGVHVPVNPMFRENEIRYELEDSGARFGFVQYEFSAEFSAASNGTAIERVIANSVTTDDFHVAVTSERARFDQRLADILNDRQFTAPDDPSDVDAIAALNYTGGTTGKPKGCEHSQYHMLYTAVTGAQINYEMTSESVSLLYFPVFWIAGEDALLASLITGGCCVLMRRWDATTALEQVDKHRVTTMMGTVDNFVEILDHPHLTTFDLSSVETVTTTSFVTKLSVDIRRRWARESGSNAIMRESSYGLTEDHTIDTFTLGLQTDDFDLSTGIQGFVGLPMPGTDIAIVDFETGTLMDDGYAGQIIVRSPSVMTGYYRSPCATAKTLCNGWLLTGDIGLFDEYGCLHYLGRRKEMLKVNGMSVFPSELEYTFSLHPAIAGSGVVGLPHEAKGQVPVAFIELKPDAERCLTEEKIGEWCRENVATYKVPRIIIVDSLPKAPTGKVSKTDLAVWAQDLLR